MSERVLIVPCSGIGKSHGTVAREAAYIVTEDLLPNKTKLMPLALLVLGEETTREAMSRTKAITIDGCKLACAAKVVSGSGGAIAREIQVLDVFLRHRDLKPSGIAELDENGHKLAQALAEDIKDVVEALPHEANHA